MAQMPKLLDKSCIEEFLNSFDNVLTDCDGVLWRGDDIIGRSNEALSLIRSLGKKILYITNNSTKTREEYAKKCESMNFVADKEDIMSSAYATAFYLNQQQFNKKVYILGASGIALELDEVGIAHTEVGPEHQIVDPLVIDRVMKLEPGVGAVVVGFDSHLSFPKIVRATSHLKDPDCLFIATNRDEWFPNTNTDLLIPSAGCMVSCVEVVVQRPPLVIGKPSKNMFSILSEKHPLQASRTLMIGDRFNTDILFGKNCNLKTMLVLTGVTKMEDLEEYASSLDEEKHNLLPDYYLPSLDDIINLLKDFSS
ncbi:glycerol-3-phosphate phosphatase-like isoform X2 [Penaeus japonicus]|nr:glycerol-3-phosphate phosphatase-like isoform X2 [Penaeus japonicus]